MRDAAYESIDYVFGRNGVADNSGASDYDESQPGKAVKSAAENDRHGTKSHAGVTSESEFGGSNFSPHYTWHRLSREARTTVRADATIRSRGHGD